MTGNKRGTELSHGLTIAPARSRSRRKQGNPSSPIDPQSSQLGFEFLNFTHPSDAKASLARRTVRSHVTRQQHQKEHAAAAARKANNVSQLLPPLGNRAMLTPNDCTANVWLEQNTGEPYEQLYPCNDAEDARPCAHTSSALQRDNPFDRYPHDWHPWLLFLLDLYLSQLATVLAHGDRDPAKDVFRSRFSALILTDPASLDAVLLMATSHHLKAHGPRSTHPVDASQLRDMAMREINHALADQRRATSDPMVVAVAHMACHEALHGQSNLFHTHMTGLARMVDLRGGLAALGADGALERLLRWVDVSTAEARACRPYFDEVAMQGSARWL